MSLTKWSTSSRFFHAKGSQIISLIPLFGYAILWSDAIDNLFSYSVQLGDGFLPHRVRLYLLYFGSLFVFIGWFVYLLHCPREIKRHYERENFVNECITSADRGKAKIAMTILRRLKQLKESGNLPIVIDDAVMNGLVEESIDKLTDAARPNWFSDQGREHMSVVLSAYYNLQDASFLGARRLTFAAYSVGVFSLLLPSFEVLLLVLYSLPRVLL
jgi:hypothetical protein